MSVTRTRVVAASMLAVALSAGYLAQGTYAAGTPANKVAASGSSIERLDAAIDTVLLSETVKINNPTDLILGVSLECGIATTVENHADGEVSKATGEIKIWVTIDGVPVPVGATDADQGRVIFCAQDQSQQWTNSPDSNDNDEEDTLKQHLETRHANAFNWMALNVGAATGSANNTHVIQVHGLWTATTAGEAIASGTVGNRTLVLEPVKAAVGEVVTELN